MRLIYTNSLYRSSLHTSVYTFEDVTSSLVDEFFWFGLVYNSWLGVVTLYIDGDVRYMFIIYSLYISVTAHIDVYAVGSLIACRGEVYWSP